MAKTIVVVGGGFAGVKCAKSLRSLLSKDQFDIVVFASENHMVFYPLLAEVASSSINPKHMAAPLRELLKDVRVRMEEVSNIDLENSEITYESFETGAKKFKYDHLVIACGNTSNLAVVPGMADDAFPMKTVGDAMALQLHIINQLERAEICDDPKHRKRILSVAVVGGGFSGVEVAGELHDFMTRAARYYSNFCSSDISVTLIHSHDQILPEVSSSLRVFAKREMEKQGIKFLLNSGASFCTVDGVGLKGGDFLEACTVICTVGTRPLSIIEKLAIDKERGRIRSNADMSVPGFANAWAIGDCAAVPNAYDGQASPTTGQFAERQGDQVAHNVAARIKGASTKPFRHKSLGVLCSIGGKNAVAETFGLKFSGFFAWMMWRGTYLFKLPSIAQQIGVGITWFFDLWFPPSLSGLRTDQSKKVGNAFYKAGDWVFQHGQPATEFYAIKQGEVEIINHSNGNDYVIATLKKGDFFGESALMDKRSHRHSSRAKTELELLVLGKTVFEEISETLTPLKTALADAINRRRFSLENHPELKNILEQISISEILESVSTEMVDQSESFQNAVSKFNNGKLDILYVVDEQQKLQGIISRSDLMKVMESHIHHSEEEPKHLPAKAFMAQSPMCLTQTDSTVRAVLAMREHGIKRMPVTDDNNVLLGCLRIENIIEQGMQKMMEKRRVLSGKSAK